MQIQVGGKKAAFTEHLVQMCQLERKEVMTDKPGVPLLLHFEIGYYYSVSILQTPGHPHTELHCSSHFFISALGFKLLEPGALKPYIVFLYLELSYLLEELFQEWFPSTGLTP